VTRRHYLVSTWTLPVADSTGRRVALAEAIDEDGRTVFVVLDCDAPTLPAGGTKLASQPDNAPEHDLLREED
jgi:hypothetical protein